MAFDAYIKFETIPGESTDQKHKDWIEAFSFSHGLTQQGSGVIASHGARTAGKVDHHDFVITKKLDCATPKLNLHCCSGKHIGTAIVEICRSTGNKEVLYKFTLEKCVVSSINIGGGQGQESPVETVGFSYAKIKWEYNKIDPKTGSKTSTVPAEWNVLENVGA
jgi:type VI secretion system secreted protein Hcp